MKLGKKDGFTQKQMAKRLGIARSTYTGYEIGSFHPSFERALKIKEILNYKNDDIFLD